MSLLTLLGIPEHMNLTEAQLVKVGLLIQQNTSLLFQTNFVMDIRHHRVIFRHLMIAIGYRN